MVGTTIIAGGFVAGLHAGMTYNTYPLMDGRLVPDGYADLHPFVLNLTENIAAVQFNHRVLATLTLLLVSIMAVIGLRGQLPLGLAIWLAAAVATQYILGVVTLLWAVPVPVAVLHQFGAIVLLTAVLVVTHHMTGHHRIAAVPRSNADAETPTDQEACPS
jgi:cytochrome c oxidase assembly protein subunit 15